MKGIPLLLVFLIAVSGLMAQETDEKEKYTPYELMSSYYNEDFKPFKKKNIYVGLAFSLEDRKLSNTSNILLNVIEGERLNYDLVLRSGYYVGNYGMVGLDFNYYQNRFDGDVYRDPDTVQSNTITRGFAFTPNFRSSIPLTSNERLSFFVLLGTTFGSSNSLSRNTRNLDEIEKVYSTDFNFRVGVSPGITFFAIESFAFEIQLDLLGYELTVSKQRVDNGPESRVIQQNVDFKIQLLSLQLGLAYYIGKNNGKTKS